MLAIIFINGQRQDDYDETSQGLLIDSDVNYKHFYFLAYKIKRLKAETQY